MAKPDTGAIQYYKDVAFYAVDIDEVEEIALFNERETASPERVKEINDRLVLSVLKLANDLALRYASGIPGIDPMDAIQEANEAAIDTLRLYNPAVVDEKGQRIRFNTYAHYRIGFKVKEMIMKQSRLVKVPKGQLGKLFKVLEALKDIGPDGTIEELAEKLGIPTEEAYERLELMQGTHSSLDQVVRNDDGKDQTLKDMIPQPDHVLNQEQEYERKVGLAYLNDKAKEVLVPYDDMTYEVTYYRFLDPKNVKVRTYEETARKMFEAGVTEKILSREWIRQLEGMALERLKRHAPEVKGILG